jgi:nicotinamidase-related amidase
MSRTALLILDLITDFEFEHGEEILRAAAKIAPSIRRLKRRLKKAGIPVIYVNDDLGQWRSDRRALLAWCLRPESKGHGLVSDLLPDDDDYFILKPKHSGFFATPLNTLLQELGIKKLILTGTTTHQCVLFTAVDAYVRDYALTVPRDGVAAASPQDTMHALHIFRSALNASTPQASSIRIGKPKMRKTASKPAPGD